jgi:hypothetical protein
MVDRFIAIRKELTSMALSSDQNHQKIERQAGKPRKRLWQSVQAFGGISLLGSSLLGSVALAQESIEVPTELASPPPDVMPEAAAPVPEVVQEAPLPAPTIAPPSDFSPELSSPPPFAEPIVEPSYAPSLAPSPEPSSEPAAPIDSSDLYSTGATSRPDKGFPSPSQPIAKPAADSKDESPTIVITDRAKPGKVIHLDGSPTTPTAVGTITPNPDPGQIPNPGSYSVGRPSANPIEAAANYLGRGLAPSFNIAANYARSIRPLPLRGNGDRQFLYPLSITSPISSVFGWRLHPIQGEWKFHSGTDFAAEEGTPVVAPISGRVSTADFVGGYGLTVALDHNANQQTLYAHLSQIFVKQGQFVKQGEVIGLVGSTGNSTGPHLHFEVRQLTEQGWIAVDPAPSLETAVAGVINLLQNKPGKPFAPNGPLPTIAVRGSLPTGTIALNLNDLTGYPGIPMQQQPVKLNTPLEKTIAELMQALQTSRSSSYAALPVAPGITPNNQPLGNQPPLNRQPSAQLPPVPASQPMVQQPMVRQGQPISALPIEQQAQPIAPQATAKIALQLPPLPKVQR